MKNRILVNMLMAAMLVCLWSASAHAVAIDFVMSDSYITVGENFDVEVWVDGEGLGGALFSFGFDVILPGTYYTYDGYTLGHSNLGDFGVTGFNDVAATAFPEIWDDNILLATLSFTAVSDGTESLQVYGPSSPFSGLFYDISGVDIDASTPITVNPAPIPEPSTMFLLGAGLVGLGGVFRKRKSS